VDSSRPADGEETAAPQLDSTANRTATARRGRIIGTIIYWIVKLLGMTVRLSVVNPEGFEPGNGSAIFVTWHGRTLIPAYYLRNRGYWAMISWSRDGEIQNNIFTRLGYRTARGSTGRGGMRAALQLAREIRAGGVLTFTPDGPRGPTHKVQLGVIVMAQKSGAPIIPVGISFDRSWSMRSWDRYLVPRPFARGWLIAGEPIQVPKDLDQDGRQSVADEVELAMNRVERQAERLAGRDDYPEEWRT
jgi:lysophospholipid acyltransferase (LPLAT)-like uncharacterized protein